MAESEKELKSLLMKVKEESEKVDLKPEYSLERLKLKLKLQSFGHLMQRTDSLEKTLVLRETEGRRKRG